MQDILRPETTRVEQIGEMTKLQTLHVSTANDRLRSVCSRHYREGGEILCIADNLTVQESAVENICKLDQLTEVRVASAVLSDD